MLRFQAACRLCRRCWQGQAKLSNSVRLCNSCGVRGSFCVSPHRPPTRCSGTPSLRPRSLVGGQPSRSPGGSRNAVGDVSASLRSAQHDSVVSWFHNGASLLGECCRCAVPLGCEALAGRSRTARRQTAGHSGAACRFASMPVRLPPPAARRAATARRPVLLAHRRVARRALLPPSRQGHPPRVVLPQIPPPPVPPSPGGGDREGEDFLYFPLLYFVELMQHFGAFLLH